MTLTARLHLQSIPLLILGAGVFLVALAWAAAGGYIGDIVSFGMRGAFALTFLALWAITSIRAQKMGIRSSRMRYSTIAVIATLSAGTVLGVAGSEFGTITLMGLGFFIVGWGTRQTAVWVSAAVTSVVGLFTSSRVVRQMIGIVETDVNTHFLVFIQLALGVTLMALGLLYYNRELRVLRSEN